MTSVGYDLYLYMINEEISSIYDKDDSKLPIYLKKKQNVDEKYEFLKVRLYPDIKELLNKFTLYKFLGESKKDLMCDIIYNGKQLEVYNKEYYLLESFPIALIPKIFDFTRFLMVTDREGKNPEILNSAEIREKKLENINKGPVESCDYDTLNIYEKFAELAIIIHPEQKINYNISGDENYINSLKESPNLENLLADMINFVYEKKNFFKLTGYLFPWRKENRERIYNIFDLKDSDLEYFVKLINNFIDSIIIFFKKLKIKKLSNININNIEIFFHYPNGNSDIHAQFKIYSDSDIINKIEGNRGYIHSIFVENEINKRRRFKFNYYRKWDAIYILNILKTNKNIFEKMEYTAIFTKSRYINILKLKKLELIKNQDGGNLDSKFVKWINTYINYEKIFKNYILPPIFIDFEIIEERKPIRMEKLYNEYLKCADINKYNIVFKNFYSKLFGGYLNISKADEFINFTSRLLLKNINNTIMINQKNLYKNQFYIDDDFNFINYKSEYDNFYDLIIIISDNTVFNRDTLCKTFLHLKKNIISLIWALKHLNKYGCIKLLIRETFTPCSTDLLLLLKHFCSINLHYDLILNDGIHTPLHILCTNFKNIDILISHLDKILTFNIDANTGFFKIKKIIMGNIEKFYKITLKPSVFLYNRHLNYIDCFKNDDGEFEIMSPEIEHFIIIKVMSLITKSYIPKPENMDYVSSLLELKKIKINGKYIDINSNIKKEEGVLLYKLIKYSKANKILELGMDYGISSLFILQSLKYFNNKYNDADGNYKLVSIDPYQKNYWQEIGLENLKKSHLISHHKLKEDSSYIVLPELIKKNKIYDIIFIDGWHTLDYVSSDLLKSSHFIKSGWNSIDYILNDILNSYHLVKIDGYLVINNVLNPGISKILNYVETNYPFLKKIETDIKAIAVYLKMDKDEENII